MVEEPIIGRVLRASTTGFQLGCNRLMAAQNEFIPEFGALVKAIGTRGDPIYGLIYDVSIEDDASVRQLVAGGLDNREMIEDQRSNRLALITVSVLVTGYGRDNEIYQRLPPQPPGTLDEIYSCSKAELVRFTERHEWLRTVLGAADAPAEQLVAAAVRRAGDARSTEDEQFDYRLDAARELARLLADDPPRLEGILRQLH